MAPTWTAETKTNFLVHIIMSGGPNQKNFADIADKMGGPHTAGSLAVKWHRIKKEYEKTYSSSGKTTGSDKAAGAGKAGKKCAQEGEGGEMKVVKRTKKAQAVKEEPKIEKDGGFE